jgi:anti-sigma factor RsiW
MSIFDKEMCCTDVAPLLVFYVCDEVSEQERRQIDAHLAACADCAAQLAEERRFSETLSAALQPIGESDPAGILLAQCRSELAESLDDLSAPPVLEHWQPFGWMRRWMALRPVLSGGLLVACGVLLGTQVWPLIQAANPASANAHVVNVMAKPRLSDDQLSKMAVAGFNWSPSSDSSQGTVQLQINAEQPVDLSGNIDDTDVRRVLTYIVENGERFDAGVRLDCLDALRTRAREEEVRRSLLAAAQHDQSPAVRMKALESLRDSAMDDDVRQALLEVLARDSNPGVRVEAVNLLVRSLERNNSENSLVVSVPSAPQPPPEFAPPSDPSVERVVRALEDLQRRDPSRYVRLRSAAALRQIGPHELQ